MERFNKEASNWDNLPRRVILAKSVVKNITPFIKNKKVLEFGCATGLVGLNIAHLAEIVIGIDTSHKMVEQFNKKAKNLNLNAKAKAYVKNIFEINESFDVVISSMTLHHIKDIRQLSKKLYEITDNVLIADLVKEDGSFHTRGNDDVAHFGFTKEKLKNYFKEWNLEYKIIHTIKKHKEFPVFLIKLSKNIQAT